MISYFIIFIKLVSGKGRKKQVGPNNADKLEDQHESVIQERQNNVESNENKSFPQYVSEYVDQHQHNENLEVDIKDFKKKINDRLKQIMQQLAVQAKRTKKQYFEINENLDTIVQKFSRPSPETY